ncbi:hypothetical protein ACVIHI_008317 [Bradyrhizobium sp. USDA 4524]|uniref:hypothetical protein n=1 Tax=unclassified Bradyrhizobium TaxID=2631580 RepID=UPI00209FABEA|nr:MULTISPECIES: hypothetical protein [unclassified Bradyrhizobium]MCP1838758.1 hypothetical protein [Bradyrhizobium sp. USDA 4538]MCP1899324.1 hypothetical protein [Bradyrhizobium sp. USDA 4537]MCP1986564.1 hypothetical protein [Bradyrhizobium sp. USDA 4539]
MSQSKELFINSVRQVRVQGQSLIPTVVLYKEKKTWVGFDALENSDQVSELREDFKVQIGNDDPIKLAQSRSGSSSGQGRSTLGIAKDFMDAVVAQAMDTIRLQGYEAPSRILVAEPLSLIGTSDRLDHEDWLKNYRGSIRRILGGKFAEIDFMPEPFAVFQYYRYGVKHPLVAQRARQIALVFDFGGGTFDASIIETTIAGDISQSGRNSKPLAARSLPVGGFVINHAIARELLFRGMDRSIDKSAVNRALEVFPQLKNADDETLAGVRSDQAAFVRNYRRVLRSVEQAKLTVSSGITSWKLDANLTSSPACVVDIPQKPLQESSTWIPIRFEPTEFRSIFSERIWKQKLLPEIQSVLKRAEQELGGRPITVVLLSGGSSNIGWLKPLIERDLSSQLDQAEILELSENFQEIVSKGLAVECARRYYTQGQGDFRAITYNRLCLGLNPNNHGLEVKKFSPDSPELEGIDTDLGVLLPSSTSLRSLINRPLRWKVRLSKAPSQSLEYFFMRSSFDPEEAGARHNLDTRIATPKGAVFGSGIGIELLVREDGTAEPSFIYGRGSQGQQSVVKGRPFYVDMTYAAQEAGGETYLGFDFGTSTSSLCYVNAGDIRVYADRAMDRTWMTLNDLIDVLPYPTAYPLRRFLSETTPDQMDRWGREALEAALGLAAYVAYAEHCTHGGPQGTLFKALRQRSAGPLWDMFKRCASMTGPKWIFAKELLALTQEPHLTELNHAVSQLAQTKHGKRADGLDYSRTLERVGNVLAKCFNGKLFGYFEDARRKPFSTKTFQGIFRNARGSSPPFIDVYEYEGMEDFPQEFVFVLDVANGAGLSLFPLVVRGIDQARSHHEEPDFFVYDIARQGGKEIAFRAIQEKAEVVLTAEGHLGELFSATASLLQNDSRSVAISGVKLRNRIVE